MGLNLWEKLTAASIKPLIAVFTLQFTDNKGIVLSNVGAGTAVIIAVVFAQGNRTAKSMPLLVDLPGQFRWDNFWTFGEHKHYLRDGKSIDLTRLSAQDLRSQGLGEAEVASIFSSWQDQMSGITIKVSYE